MPPRLVQISSRKPCEAKNIQNVQLVILDPVRVVNVKVFPQYVRVPQVAFSSLKRVESFVLGTHSSRADALLKPAFWPGKRLLSSGYQRIDLEQALGGRRGCTCCGGLLRLQFTGHVTQPRWGLRRS